MDAHKIETSTEAELIQDEVLVECDACGDRVPTADMLDSYCEPVSHSYCHCRLFDLFAMALNDVSLFPPRCCKVLIPLKVSRAILPKDCIKEFDLKAEELVTSDPNYCANADCTLFVRSKQIEANVGTCVEYEGQTCVQRKPRAHVGLYPSDLHVHLMDAAKRWKW